jgi:hypothetical protein
MTDLQIAAEMDLGAAAAPPIQARRERQLPLGVIVYVVLAVAAQALWLGALGWWFLNLF